MLNKKIYFKNYLFKIIFLLITVYLYQVLLFYHINWFSKGQMNLEITTDFDLNPFK
jgi:uncharacterized protein YggT (Ycf19 family)